TARPPAGPAPCSLRAALPTCAAGWHPHPVPSPRVRGDDRGPRSATGPRSPRRAGVQTAGAGDRRAVVAVEKLLGRAVLRDERAEGRTEEGWPPAPFAHIVVRPVARRGDSGGHRVRRPVGRGRRGRIRSVARRGRSRRLVASGGLWSGRVVGGREQPRRARATRFGIRVARYRGRARLFHALSG